MSNKKGLNEVILKSLLVIWFYVYKNWYIIKDFSWPLSNPSFCRICLKPKSLAFIEASMIAFYTATRSDVETLLAPPLKIKSPLKSFASYAKPHHLNFLFLHLATLMMSCQSLLQTGFWVNLFWSWDWDCPFSKAPH